MINNPETFKELGKLAAQCRNRRDEAGALHHSRHFRECRNVEQGEDRQTAERLYNEAYTQYRNAPKPEPFK